uniref:HSA domain-containing protein n=3 Tax=Macrostomum lignano TaxID=282301 RepID=A0A1I8IL30_9PLAT
MHSSADLESSRTEFADTLQSLLNCPEKCKIIPPAANPSEAQSHDHMATPGRKRGRRVGDFEDYLRARSEMDGAGGKHQREQFIIKLFDRLMDFGPFLDMSEGRTDGCPIYPMARAWVANLNAWDQKSDTTKWGDLPDHRSEEIGLHQGAVLDLPAAHDGLLDSSVRVPAPLPSEDERLDIHRAPELAPAPEQLLLDHLDRWREVRRSWCSAMRANDRRYSDAMRVLNVCRGGGVGGHSSNAGGAAAGVAGSGRDF